MKGILIFLVLAFPLATLQSAGTSAQALSAVPIDIEIPMAPTPVKANGAAHLLYELHLTNFSSRTIEVVRLDVLDDSSKVLATYKDDELATRLARPGAAQTSDKRKIAGGMRAIVFLEIIIQPNARIPLTLLHRLYSRSTDDKTEEEIKGALVRVNQSIPPVMRPPLRGSGWVALSGMSNTSGHRRTIVVVNGKARIAQRFATDWVRVGPDGLAFRGDPAKLTSWSAYGAEVRSASPGRVVDVRDGIPDNDPTADKKAIPITVESAPGNYLIIALGNGFFSFYAHLQPKSIRVRKGDRVRSGQVLALLGNSGNSDSPHLHFHITDGNSPLGAEGVPYVLDSFELLGILQAKSLLIEGGWKPEAGQSAVKRRLEIPTENAVVRFSDR